MLPRNEVSSEGPRDGSGRQGPPGSLRRLGPRLPGPPWIYSSNSLNPEQPRILHYKTRSNRTLSMVQRKAMDLWSIRRHHLPTLGKVGGRDGLGFRWDARIRLKTWLWNAIKTRPCLNYQPGQPTSELGANDKPMMRHVFIQDTGL